MNYSGNSVTACQFCHHYNPEGRRGGLCGKLDVQVQSTWDACSLATHPFESSWQHSNNLNSLLHESFNETLAIRSQIKALESQEIKMRSLSFAQP
jgi:hypothetical protein